jgi:hypothetical protein
MKGELRGRGANSISNFGHHNIYMAALATIHDVTGRSRIRVIYPSDSYGEKGQWPIAKPVPRILTQE